MGRANSEKNVTIQVVSSMVEVAQSIIGAGAVFTESRRSWGNLPEDTASKAQSCDPVLGLTLHVGSQPDLRQVYQLL